MPSFRTDLGLLGQRRFALLFAARTVSVLGSAVAPVAVAFGVLGLPGGTPTALSVVLTAQSVPMLLLMLLGGVLADRFPRYRVMMAGELLSAVAYAALAVMFLRGGAPLPLLAGAAAVSGIGLAVFFPSLVGIVPDVVAMDRLQVANGVLRLGTNAARIAGYALGGGAVVILGAGRALLFGAAMFALSAACVAALRLGGDSPREPGAGAAGGMLRDLRDGWREFRSRQWLWVIVLQFSLMMGALQAAHGVLGPVVANERLGGAGAWAAVLAGEGVGMMLGVFVAIRIRPRRPMLLGTLVTLPAAVPWLLLGLAAPLWSVVAAAVLMGACFDIFGVLWETTLQREIPPAALSRVSAYDALGSLMFGPIGLLVAGPAAAHAGPALLGCAGVFLVATLGALLSPSVRSMRAPDRQPRAADADPVPAG